MAKRNSYRFSAKSLDVCEKRARYAYDSISWTRAVHEREAKTCEGRRKALGVLAVLCFIAAAVCILLDCFIDIPAVRFTALGLVVVGLYFEVVLRVRDFGRRAAKEEQAARRFLELQRDAMNVLSAVRFGGLEPAEASELVNDLEDDYQAAVDAAGPVSEAAVRRAERALAAGAGQPKLEAGEAYLPDYLKEKGLGEGGDEGEGESALPASEAEPRDERPAPEEVDATPIG